MLCTPVLYSHPCTQICMQNPRTHTNVLPGFKHCLNGIYMCHPVTCFSLSHNVVGGNPPHWWVALLLYGITRFLYPYPCEQTFGLFLGVLLLWSEAILWTDGQKPLSYIHVLPTGLAWACSTVGWDHPVPIVSICKAMAGRKQLIYMAISLSPCLSLYLSLSICLCLFLCPSVPLSLFLSLCLSLYFSLSLSLSLCLSLSLSDEAALSHTGGRNTHHGGCLVLIESEKRTAPTGQELKQVKLNPQVGRLLSDAGQAELFSHTAYLGCTSLCGPVTQDDLMGLKLFCGL